MRLDFGLLVLACLLSDAGAQPPPETQPSAELLEFLGSWEPEQDATPTELVEPFGWWEQNLSTTVGSDD